MTRPLLPPRGIFIPTYMIFNPQLPPAVLVTWIQLRCLAWDGWATHPLSISELAALIAIHPARLTKHLSQLQDISALSCRTAGQGKIIIAFPEEPTIIPENYAEYQNHSGSIFIGSRNQESLDPTSYFPAQILGYLSIQEDQDASSKSNMAAIDFGDTEGEEMEQYDGMNGFSNIRNCEFDQLTKLRNQPTLINQHSSHAHS
jgi:hypothetical protein